MRDDLRGEMKVPVRRETLTIDRMVGDILLGIFFKTVVGIDHRTGLDVMKCALNKAIKYCTAIKAIYVVYKLPSYQVYTYLKAIYVVYKLPSYQVYTCLKAICVVFKVTILSSLHIPKGYICCVQVTVLSSLHIPKGYICCVQVTVLSSLHIPKGYMCCVQSYHLIKFTHT